MQHLLGGGTPSVCMPPKHPVSARFVCVRAMMRWFLVSTLLAVSQAATSYPHMEGALSTLDIETCNGFVNQRLSILYGLVIAKRTRRAVYLPMLRLNGRQFVDESHNMTWVPFSHFYDADHFVKTISPHVPVIAPREGHARLTLHVQPHDFHLLWTQANFFREPTRIACPLFKLPPDMMLQYAPLVNAWVDAFKPASRFQSVINAAKRKLQPGRYNFLHWRAEQDWLRHCEMWKPGRTDNNCDTNTDVVAAFLAEKQVESSAYLYMATDWANVDRNRLTKVLHSLDNSKYKIITQQQLFGTKALQGLEREERALLDYEVALMANKFIGNSVSTFSALLLWQRAGWSTYYNMGDIPMAEFLPFYKIPWVFPYSTRTASYDYMIKMAVASAKAVGTLKPYCLFDGKPRGEMYKWLLANNVTVMINDVKWAKRLYSKKKSNFSHFSHLYSSPELMIGTLQRVDIPIQPQLQQYNYVLYTDADVLFAQPLYWTDFPLPLPETISMSFEADTIVPCNAGRATFMFWDHVVNMVNMVTQVMMINMVNMRRTYPAFLEHTLTNDEMYWPGFGPIDQGALNSFYMKSMNETCSLPRDLNALMLLSSTQNHTSKILHFLGPKLHQYGEWARTTSCPFKVTFSMEDANNLCELGMRAICVHLPSMLQRTMMVLGDADINREDLQALLASCRENFMQIKPVSMRQEEDVFDQPEEA